MAEEYDDIASDEEEVASRGKSNTVNQEDLIMEAKSFFNTQKKELGVSAKQGDKIVKLNFEELAEQSPELSERIITKPEETVAILELALHETGIVPDAKVRLTSLSASQFLRIRNIRAKNLNMMISIEGIVRQASEVRPRVTNAKFECPACGTILSVLQIDEKFREPSRCSCGRRGGFKELDKEMVDAQRLVIEESPDGLSGGEQPKRMTVFLKEDLVEPRMEEKTTPGCKVNIIGVLKEVPLPAKTGGILTRFDLAVEANNIMPMEESFDDINIREEDEEEIKELAADPRIIEKLSASIAPSVWGYPEIKEALALQLFGGVQKTRSDGTKTRGDMHVLLVGDPGVAKSVMLKFISGIAPKGRYVSGKSTSGAGLTATVVKDEFLRGWALEAGAMVLSNKGLVCIDELEKMDENDRSTMHEAMEQQCMLPDFKLMLSNGDYVKIGEFVDNLISKSKNKVYSGKDCEILPVDNVELLSTDFNFHFPLKASRVSRHLAPKEFVKVELSNGREITVTPEHPCWVVKDGKIITIPAENLKEGDFFPVPSKIDMREEDYESKNSDLCKILGYHISDGCYELNRGKKTGIQFWNNNEDLIKDYKLSIKNYFNLNPIITKRKNQFAVRVISKIVFEEMMKIDSNLLEKGRIKRIPYQIMKLPKENIKYLLRALYDGDGSVSLQNRNGGRISLVSENRELAEQVSDLLLRFEIQSSIFYDNHSSVWRIDVSGQENLSRFMMNIGFLSVLKQKKLEKYCEQEKTHRTITDIVPNCTNKIHEIFKKLKISARKEIGHSIDLGVEKQRVFLQKLVKIALARAISINAKEVIEELKTLERLAFGYSRWVKIKKASKIKNEGIKWVYDVTIEPHHTFISNGMILHNTVTISKANVQASLRAQTSVLAAANPKFGRFDPHEMIAKQVNLAPSLLNRFDVLFILRDLPDKIRDESIAAHVLNEHKQTVHEGIINKELLRKYIAYAKQHCHPLLTDEAIRKIKTFYVNLRNQPSMSGDTIKPIPISARQLEALIRLAEATSKARLGKTVTEEDAQRAINLMKFYMMQVGYDEETKSFDIDKISGNPASKRNKIFTLKEILEDLEGRLGKLIPMEEVEKAANGKLKTDELEEAIDKLVRAGDLFRPRKGYVQRM
jgi:replicative DNA helicase Mcm